MAPYTYCGFFKLMIAIQEKGEAALTTRVWMLRL